MVFRTLRSISSRILPFLKPRYEEKFLSMEEYAEHNFEKDLAVETREISEIAEDLENEFENFTPKDLLMRAKKKYLNNKNKDSLVKAEMQKNAKRVRHLLLEMWVVITKLMKQYRSFIDLFDSNLKINSTFQKLKLNKKKFDETFKRALEYWEDVEKHGELDPRFGYRFFDKIEVMYPVAGLKTIINDLETAEKYIKKDIEEKRKKKAA